MALENLNTASNQSILAALSNLRNTYNIYGAWLDPNNHYCVDTIQKIHNDINNNSINHNDLINYIATSALIHCFNGWSYLSTSVNSFLAGDFSNAIHNAYYAELRGIMSLLASQGIGVFNGKNVIVKSNGIIEPTTSLSTHLFVKKALDEWLKIPANSQIILSHLTIENRSLSNWLTNTGFFSNSTLPNRLAKNWFQAWSIDLSIIDEESKFRNFVSYNPQTININLNRYSEDVRNRLSYLKELWTLCSPNNLFAQTLLRNSLETLYQDAFGYTLNQVPVTPDWNALFADLGLNPHDSTSNYLIRFFRREVEPIDSQIFDFALNTRPSDPMIEQDTDPIGIISRACLILMLTTKIIETMLLSTGTTKANLEFWYNNIGIKQGYWEPNNVPDLYSDLWTDIELEIEEINNWLNDNSINHSPFTLKKGLIKKMPEISSLDKSYLWNLGG